MSVIVYTKDQLDPEFQKVQNNLVIVNQKATTAASDAAAAKGSAASAVQAIKVNGQTYSATNGVADLGTIAAGNGGFTATESSTIPGAYALSDASGSTATESSTIPGAYAI